jgi:MYXO-CTERM domain-containing protein
VDTFRKFGTRVLLFGLLFSAVTLPAVAQMSTDRGVAVNHDDDHGFDDWGLLGLLGLAGLLGRKRDRTVVDTRRV